MQGREPWVRQVSYARNTRALDELFSELPRTLTVDEVSGLLNFNRKNVYVWLRDGVIPGYKLGGTWFILRDELKEALREGTNAPNQSATDPGTEELKEE